MVGIGYDIHRFESGTYFILGGEKIESEMAVVAHSDGDVLYHALCDCLLGAAGLGDIGEHFPDNDITYKNMDSSELVKIVMKMLTVQKLRIVNIDATILLEKPKILSYKEKMKKNISSLCYLPVEKVNIKATTNERVGFIGRGEGIAAICVCEIQPLI
ncbi:MAG: 2-C-methyl-D-erythritol 2,4-cyclodiphosphate synthase [Ignavibacteria bacterium]|nr:2-C-methyl-D-erythritol 2,4-cyclodiphosphate synthase [Ignavibacteria bacterium]